MGRDIVINGDGEAVYRETHLEEQTAEDLARLIESHNRRIEKIQEKQLEPLIERRDELVADAVRLANFQPG